LKLTPEEIRNGWDEATLKAYLAEREAQRVAFSAEEVKLKNFKVENTSGFNPHNWR